VSVLAASGWFSVPPRRSGLRAVAGDPGGRLTPITGTVGFRLRFRSLIGLRIGPTISGRGGGIGAFAFLIRFVCGRSLVVPAASSLA